MEHVDFGVPDGHSAASGKLVCRSPGLENILERPLMTAQNMAMEDGTIKSCSNFTVLTAFAWHARSKALQMNPDQASQLVFMVDVRSKLNPPLPKGYCGNGIVISSCLCTAGALIENSLSFAVKPVQNGIE
ncbi:unnamed protein product [Dovyalis caffra]|uniref:Uncharacterized protein n=1 Tax=Dovyalis caffra TaxID=77055 RepID=A0AAV1SDQ9_9ROSI|nr:unnamed protein product [Dovyalis caffra]